MVVNEACLFHMHSIFQNDSSQFCSPKPQLNFLNSFVLQSGEVLWVHRLPRWLSGKETEAGDMGSIPQSGRSPGGGNGNPLQYSCMEKFHGKRRLAGYSPWSHIGLDMTEHARMHTLGT